LIEFPNIFDIDKGIADPDLDSKLSTPSELSGLLNLALGGLKRLQEKGWRFSYNKTAEDVEMMYKRNANPVYAFLLEECIYDPDSYIEKGEFYRKFKEYAESHKLRPVSLTKFGQLLKDQSEIPVSDFRPYASGEASPRCWLGVRLKQSTPSIVLATPSLTKNEKEKEEEKNNKKIKVGINKTLDGVDGPESNTNTEGNIKAQLQLAKKRRKQKDDHFKTPGPSGYKPDKTAVCPGCGADIGPGHSSQTFEGKTYCANCPPKLSILSPTVEALTEKLGRPPTTDEIHEDLSKRGRPPLKKNLPSMLRALDFEEKDGGWVACETKNDEPAGAEEQSNRDLCKHDSM
jgi:hypothetical protein